MRIHPNPWQTLKYCDNVADIAIMQKGGRAKRSTMGGAEQRLKVI